VRLVLAFAVRCGALKSNPVADVEVQRTGRSEMIFLDPDQIMASAGEVTALPQRYRRGERRRGNPRQLKRFLNMLLLRLETARRRGVELDAAVLAKPWCSSSSNRSSSS
jgi:hypothetical protein